MLCVYSYLDVHWNVYGDYQCDTEDFKMFWRKCQSQICMCYVRLQNGECWAYADGFGWASDDRKVIRFSNFHDEINMEDYIDNFYLF